MLSPGRGNHVRLGRKGCDQQLKRLSEDKNLSRCDLDICLKTLDTLTQDSIYSQQVSAKHFAQQCLPSFDTVMLN